MSTLSPNAWNPAVIPSLSIAPLSCTSGTVDSNSDVVVSPSAKRTVEAEERICAERGKKVEGPRDNKSRAN